MSSNALLAARFAAVRQRIAQACHDAGRDPADVQLLAVSKTVPALTLRAAQALGQHAFGESYLAEALPKLQALAEQAPEWHFIGPIQANKTRGIAAYFTWVHSVDRLKIASRLDAQRPPELPPLQLCLQVNISGEASKAGVSLDALPELAAAVAGLPRLRLRGLMAIPAPSDDPARQRSAFRRLRQALDQLNAQGLGLSLGLDTLSMGMSNDLEAAIAEGATWVRVGSALFGARA